MNTSWITDLETLLHARNEARSQRGLSPPQMGADMAGRRLQFMADHEDELAMLADALRADHRRVA